MDRRREPRFETDHDARVTLLGPRPVVMRGQTVNISGRGMRLRLDRPVPYSAPIRVDVDDSIILGEVCYVEPDGDAYAVGLMLDQVLHDTTELAPLIEAIRTEEQPEPKPVA